MKNQKMKRQTSQNGAHFISNFHCNSGQKGTQSDLARKWRNFSSNLYGTSFHEPIVAHLLHRVRRLTFSFCKLILPSVPSRLPPAPLIATPHFRYLCGPLTLAIIICALSRPRHYIAFVRRTSNRCHVVTICIS